MEKLADLSKKDFLWGKRNEIQDPKSEELLNQF